MPPRRLIQPTQPRSGTAAFEKIRAILHVETYEIPNRKKYNGNGGPGRLLEHLLGLRSNNADSPDLADWEIKFHGGNALLTLFHKDPEPNSCVKYIGIVAVIMPISKFPNVIVQ